MAWGLYKTQHEPPQIKGLLTLHSSFLASLSLSFPTYMHFIVAVGNSKNTT